MPTISIVKGQELLFIGDEYRLKTQVDSAPQDFLNFQEKQATGGWSNKRSLRKVASIPVEIFSRLPPEIRNDDQELKKWIKAHPEMCTADRLGF
jgi:hypothetical protein